ncbi:hypothetical protein SK3146_04089 [Paenibacillus konkukensis]|uniref:Copper amine oxidase-like N-terminal domain-containing protein n=1 Tax=Paenibacillus konkukensis TaxID=2020716 RepID=A0ABY4RQQ9_9BACL|nr:stalk domain-containing protein [Paenibacillus konkukensis]UQZ84834.1 hypothetical protein SK3146_04089 [Paenibacillus konkukensis]
MAAAVSASDSIRATIFPVNFDINGQTRQLDGEYSVLNYNGHIYTPVRFIAESLGAVIDYDADKKQVWIKQGDLALYDRNFSGFYVGNLIAVKEGTRTKVTGQMKVQTLLEEENAVEASLTFYNNKSEVIGIAGISSPSLGRNVQTFESYADGDITGYTTVTLNINAINGRVIGENTSLNDTKIPLTQILNNDFNHIARIEIRYMDRSLLEIKDSDVIDDIAARLKSVELLTALHQDKTAGWMYYMDIYTGEEKVRYINTLQLNGRRYLHSSATDSLDAFILSLQK